jgi:hypothetical protein
MPRARASAFPHRCHYSRFYIESRELHTTRHSGPGGLTLPILPEPHNGRQRLYVPDWRGIPQQ